MNLQVVPVVRGRESALADLRVVRVILVSLLAARVRISMMVRAELLFGVVVHHIYFLEIDLFFLENIAA